MVPVGAPVRSLRAAVPLDAPLVSALLHQSWLDTYSSLMGRERAFEASATRHAPPRLIEEFNNPAITTLVAYDSLGTLLGVIKVDTDDGVSLHLDRLHVPPAAKGLGVARQLLDAALARWPSAKSIDLEVLAGNDRAIAFYHRNGFVIARELDACGAVLGVRTFVMRKDL